MGFDLFPHSMNSFKNSKHPKALRLLRLLGLLVSGASCGYGLYSNQLKFFLYYDSWVVASVFSFYLISTLGYFWDSLDKLACLLFVNAWALIWAMDAVGRVFMGVKNFYPETMSLLLILDFVLGEIAIIRSQYILPFFLILSYSVGILVLYDGTVYLLLVVTKVKIIAIAILFVAAAFALEIARFVRTRSCKEDEKQHSLL